MVGGEARGVARVGGGLVRQRGRQRGSRGRGEGGGRACKVAAGSEVCRAAGR